ncbi:MAG: hypothetical protein ACE5H4_15945, partial [Candidatus Thorarchaeota archaeon]
FCSASDMPAIIAPYFSSKVAVFQVSISAIQNTNSSGVAREQNRFLIILISSRPKSQMIPIGPDSSFLRWTPVQTQFPLGGGRPRVALNCVTTSTPA